jgi:prepilin-type N-terminal cleavage/methylation domain-containing protein
MRERGFNQKGYTLIELLLYVALVGVLLSAITAFFGIAAEARIKNQTINEVNEQGAYAMEYMARITRSATNISSPAAAATGSSLTLVVPTATLSPTVLSVTNNVLYIKEGTGATISLTTSKVKVDALNITNLTRSGTSPIVQISLTLSRVNALSRNEYDYQRTFTTSVGTRP